MRSDIGRRGWEGAAPRASNVEGLASIPVRISNRCRLAHTHFDERAGFARLVDRRAGSFSRSSYRPWGRPLPAGGGRTPWRRAARAAA